MSRIVLVADDNMTIQRMATEMLAEQGLEVVTVANGMAAIKKLATVRPVLVLADVDMPGRDGYEVCDFVKQSAELRDVPVILAFSDADPFDQERVKAVRADGVVKKPFNKLDLFARIEEFVPKAVAETATASEMHPQAAAQEQKAPDLPPPPTEFTFNENPTPPASFAGIPEGSSLFEPAFATAIATQPGSEALQEAVPAFPMESPAYGLEDSRQGDAAAKGELTMPEEPSHQPAAASSESAALEFSIEQHSAAPIENGHAFAELGISSATIANSLGARQSSKSDSTAAPSLPAFMANDSVDTGIEFAELDTFNPRVSVAAQEAAPEPSRFEMHSLLQATELAEPTLEITSKENPNEGHSDSAASSNAGSNAALTVDDSASRLSDWKLPEAVTVEQGRAGLEEPVLAVLPDLTAELHFPAQVEVPEQETSNPQEAAEENHPEAFAEPVSGNVQAPMESATVEWVVSPYPTTEVSSGLEMEAASENAVVKEDWTKIPEAAPGEPSSDRVPETPAAEMEEHGSPDVSPLMEPAPYIPVPVPEPPVIPTESEASWAMPPSMSWVEAVERAAADKELPGSLASAGDDASSTQVEKDLGDLPAPAMNAFCSTAPEEPGGKSEDNPSWEIPSEAVLNEAFLEAALPRIGLIHAKATVDAPGQLVESTATLETEVPSLSETYQDPVPDVLKENEPGVVLEAPSAQALDPSLVESIVHRVVVRMSPPAFSPEMIEQLTRKLTEECLEHFQSGQL